MENQDQNAQKQAEPQAAPSGATTRGTTDNLSVENFIGNVLARSYDTLKKNLVLFAGIAFVAVLISRLIGLVFIAINPLFGLLVGSILMAILGLTVQGGITFNVFQTLRGQQVNINESFTHGLKRFLPLLLTCLLAGLGIGLGMLLLVVPGVILATIWAVAIPACVVENLGPVDSLKRSGALTKGMRWKVFAIMLIVGIITGIIDALIKFIFGDSGLIAAIISALLLAIPLAFNYVMCPVMYYDLRTIQEGASLDSIASSFK